MEEIVKKAFEAKLEDGSFEKILSKYVEDSIRSVLNGMFEKRYGKDPNGEAYDLIDGIVRPLVIESLKKSNIKAMAEKTRIAINNLVEQCSIAQVGRSLEGFTGMFDVKGVEPFSKMPLQELLFKYVQHIEKQKSHFDRDWFLDNRYDLADGCASLTCYVDVSYPRDEWGYGSDDRAHVRLHVGDDDSKETEYSYEFDIRKDYKGRWEINYRQFEPLGLDDLEKMSEFEIMLRMLSARWVELTDIKSDESYAEFDDLYD